MKRPYIILFSIIILFAGCNIFAPNEQQTMGREEHAIISAIIDSMMNTRDSVIVFSLSDSTINPEKIRYKIEKDSISIDTSLYAIFEKINEIRGALVEDCLPDNVILESVDSARNYSSTVSFSRPGISRDGRTAIIEYRWMTFPGTEVKQATLLQKQNGKWEIVWHRQMLIFETY